MRNRSQKLFVFVLLLSAFASVHAQGTTPKTASKGTTNKPQVLDFESDVIEGDRKRPDLFSQASGQNLTLDAILFLRNDFNDYQQVEQGRQPGYFEKSK